MRVQDNKPYVTVPGDDSDKLMYRAGQCIGISKDRKIWRFGFMIGSDAAFHYGVAIDNIDQYGFLWVLADYEGNVLAVFKGIAIGLPDEFKSIFDEVWK